MLLIFQLLWLFKRNLTKDDRFEYAGKEVCRHELAVVCILLQFICFYVVESINILK